MIGKLNVKYAIIFRQQFELRCLSLVIDAYQSAYSSKTITVNFDEEDITEVLNSHLDNNPKRILWQISTNTESRLGNNMVNNQKGFAKRLARIDLRFTTLTSEAEFRYYMEAKNLKISSSALKRRYIKTGIDNYISAKYNDGFLVGYVLSGSIDDNIEAVNRLLVKDSRSTEIILLNHTKVNAFDQYYSTHATIKIKHIFFDFN